MISFEKFTLDNGLRFIVHQDTATPMVAFNVLYDVGARDEDPDQTGFAHLFEHLMFGGSIHIPDYDAALQIAGGENNAYTTNDITNYYIQLPAKNIETAFWLESDRMLSLAFDPKSLEVQKKVVSEEFREHYLNKPYGDVWMHLREMAYQSHPYRWMTIGKNLEHIEGATLADVKNFFFKHYTPQNAIICVAGNTTVDQVKALAETYFAPLPAREKFIRKLLPEPVQTKPRKKTIQAAVPIDAIYKAWHIKGRMDPQYYAADVLTELLGSGQSSRLYLELVKNQQLFSSIACYHTGSLDPGLLVIEGKLIQGVAHEVADAAIEKELTKLREAPVKAPELEKAENKIEVMITFEDMNLLSRANNLAYYELLGDAGLMNEEMDRYRRVSPDELWTAANEIFTEENSNTLYYQAQG